MMSARARRSVNSCQRASRSPSAWRASSATGWRGGAVAHPLKSPSRQRRLLRRLRATLGPAPAILEVLDLLLDPLGGRVELQGLLPRGERLGLESVLQIGVAEVLVDHRVGFLRLVNGALELLQSVGVATLLVVRPAEAVDEIAVVRLDRERLADELDRLVEVLPALGVHVADVVVRLGVLGIECDHLPERADGVVELGLLLEDDAELKVEVLVLVVEAQSLPEGLHGAVVLLAAEVRGAEVEKELGPLRLEVDGVAEDCDVLVVALGPSVEESELDARVDRAGVDAQDALELRAGLGVLPAVHVRGGEEVPRPKVRRLERDGAPEGVGRPVPLFLLVEDRPELHPHTRVARRDLGERLDLRLRFLEAAEPDEQVAEPFDERRVVGVRLGGVPVDLDRLVGLAARLVHIAEGRPGAVVVGIELEGLLERGDRLGEPPRLRGHLRDHELVVRVGLGVQQGRGTPRRRVEGRRDRPSGGARGERHARQEKRGSDEQAADHRSAPRSAGNRQAFVSRRRAAAARAGSGIGEIASSIARRSAAPSGAEERGRLRGAAEGPASSSVPRVNRSARTAGNRARSRAVSSSARSVSSWSHGELSTITVRQPSTSAWGLARRATSAPTRVDHTRLTWCSASRSRSSGTAVTSRSATARGAPTLIHLYHTPSARIPRGRSAIVAAVMAKPRRGDSLELVIDDLAFGGEGVGRVNGYVVFVRGAVPGDRVRAKLVDARSRFGRAVIESIEVPSPDRVEPPCPYFGRCGGCRLQHVAYPAQLAFKEKQVRDCLERIGGLGAFELRPILPGPEPYGYRNKMEFTITRPSQATDGGGCGGRDPPTTAVG